MLPTAESTTNGAFLAPVTAQWWATPPLRPEQRLMRAVLAEALADLNAAGGAPYGGAWTSSAAKGSLPSL
jgi:hypothetical protein